MSFHSLVEEQFSWFHSPVEEQFSRFYPSSKSSSLAVRPVIVNAPCMSEFSRPG
jgi:hypothetical protein